MTDGEEKINLGCDGMYIPATREEIIEFSKQPGLTKAILFDERFPNDPKVKCVIVARYNGWITAVSENGWIIQNWAGLFHIGYTEV